MLRSGAEAHRWGGLYRWGEGCAGGVGGVQVTGAAGARWSCGSEPGSVESRVVGDGQMSSWLGSGRV